MSRETTDLVGVAEACAITGLSRPTIKKFIADGRLPVAMKMPGSTGAYLFLRADVEKLARERVA